MPKPSQARLLLLVTTVSLVAVAGLTYVNERTRADLIRSTTLVSHTLEVERSFQLLLTTMLDAETGQRGYLLTDAPNFLAPYESAYVVFDSQFARLKHLTADNISQQRRLDKLRTLIDAKMALAQETIALARAGEREAALEMVRSGRGKMLMDDIRIVMQGGLSEEEMLFIDRQAGLEDVLGVRTVLTRSLVVVLVAMLAATVYLRIRLRRLAPLVTLCAWSKTVKIGDEWVSFEEYLDRKFKIRVSHGVSPTELARLIDGARTMAKP